MRVQPRHGLGRACRLSAGRRPWLPNRTCLCRLESDHAIVVDDAQFADAAGGEILNKRRAEAARADHQDPRGLQLLLAGTTDLSQHEMARVALDFFGRKHAIHLILWAKKIDPAMGRQSETLQQVRCAASCVWPIIGSATF